MPAMMPPTTFVDSNIVRQADLNNYSTNIDTLCQINTGKKASTGVSAKPACKLILSGNFSVPTGGATGVVTWGSAPYNNDTMWSSVNPDHMVIQTPGWYRIRAQTYWGAATGGASPSERATNIHLNGLLDPLNVTASSNLNMSGTASVTAQVIAFERLTLGAAIYVGVWQNSGVAVPLKPNGSWGTWFTASYEAPY